ncbi:glycosyltransferase family 2 protein [Tenacibaculum sp. SG-28]|uniref:glycosyltransferase n=1 Tax=Tenacibaculum sp. SG-28 TaxID=754426 RepID=UPI0013049679|nr:glycosyltransferase [Tenacibaculum sp. SG-28]
MSIQYLYYLFFILLGKTKPNTKNTTRESGISILVYVKNKENVLHEFITSLLEQTYEHKEIVLVNHCSTDNSLSIMEAFSEKYKTIKIVNVANNETFWNNKKYALTLGVKAATYDCILFTESTVIPATKEWIATVANSFATTKTILIGNEKIITTKNSLLGILSKFTNILTTAQMISFVNIGIPYKAFKGNFAMHKEDFFRVNGFISHLKINNGEFDLFLQDAANSRNTTMSPVPKNTVYRNSTISLKKYLSLQKEDIKIIKEYKKLPKTFLRLFRFSKIIVYLTLPLLFFLNLKYSLGFLLVYYLLQYAALFSLIKVFKEKKLLIFLPILDCLYAMVCLYTFMSTLASSVKN